MIWLVRVKVKPSGDVALSKRNSPGLSFRALGSRPVGGVKSLVSVGDAAVDVEVILVEATAVGAVAGVVAAGALSVGLLHAAINNAQINLFERETGVFIHRL